MRRLPASLLAVLALVALAVLAVPAGAAAATMKKGIFSAFTEEDAPRLKELDVVLARQGLSWANVATKRPAEPTNPADPAYVWPPRIDKAIADNDANDIDTTIQVIYAPPWANGGGDRATRPKSHLDYSRFVAAAAKRYPTVRLWQVWGEVNGGEYVWKPQPSGSRFKTKLTRKESREPRHYARMVDATYVALKRLNRRNKIIGGMTVTGGLGPSVPPATWLKYMRLPNGKRPRMDMFGHNPMLVARRPVLSAKPKFPGWRDMSDLDTTIREVDRAYPGKKLPIFVSEFAVWDKLGPANWFVSRATAGRWTTLAMRIARRSKRVHSVSWASLRDTEGLPGWGLLDKLGAEKPTFDAFRKG